MTDKDRIQADVSKLLAGWASEAERMKESYEHRKSMSPEKLAEAQQRFAENEKKAKELIAKHKAEQEAIAARPPSILTDDEIEARYQDTLRALEALYDDEPDKTKK